MKVVLSISLMLILLAQTGQATSHYQSRENLSKMKQLGLISDKEYNLILLQMDSKETVEVTKKQEDFVRKVERSISSIPEEIEKIDEAE